jgi:hypothetical protein
MNARCHYYFHDSVPEAETPKLTRREWLARSAGVLGFWAMGGWSALLRAKEVPRGGAVHIS